MNVLTLGARVIGTEPAYECAVAFIGASSAASRATSAASTRSSPSRRAGTDDAPGRLAAQPCGVPWASAHRWALRARSGASTPTRNRPFTHARLSFGGHMTDPASTTIDAPRLRPRRRHRRLRRGRRARPRPRTGSTGSSPATRRCGRRDPRVQEAIARPARLARRAGAFQPSGSPASRASATASSTRATRRRSSPAWAAAASPRTSSIARSAARTATSRCASSTRPTRPSSPRRSTTSTRSRR